jgi:hypothetical protein
VKKLILLLFLSTLIVSCFNNSAKKATKTEAKIVYLKTDTVNVVKITDTLVIVENTCRACPFEQSTDFVIKDSLNIIKLINIKTIDNTPKDMAGGSLNNDLIMMPIDKGYTVLKMYKFLEGKPDTITQSLPYTNIYKIEIKN